MMHVGDDLCTSLLASGDPLPAVVERPGGMSPILLVCEHAGMAVPAALSGLGLPAAALAMHVGHDIGAAGVARQLSVLLDATLVLQPYSRLVVDCNRPPDAPDLAPAVSDTVAVPGNAVLTPAGRAARIAAIHAPFHARIAAEIDRRSPRPTALVTVHSFTPALARDGIARPWHIGLLSRRGRWSQVLLEALRRRRPGLVVALNEPYRITDVGDMTIPFHAEARGLPHVLIEVRNDLIGDAAGQEEWAGLLARALTETLEDAGWPDPT